MFLENGVTGCVFYPKIKMFVTGTFVILMSLLLQDGRGYNVDTEGAMIHTGEVGSMFGYSVAQHIDQSTSWLLVGAPQAQTSQRGVTKGGTVYRCKTDRKNYCHEIPFDPNGNNIKWVSESIGYKEIDDKSNQWFGATVHSSGENGVIVACAPRYVYFSQRFDKREPVGTCYVSKASTTQAEEFSPCRRAVDRLWVADQYHKQGYCQAGFSASFTSSGDKLLVAAVGSWYWQGQLYNYDIKNKSYVSTREGPPQNDDSYMGYATAVGDFDGDNKEDYAVSIPKGDLNLGRIALFTQNLSNIQNITGEQVGSYFGYSLAVTDLDGDGRDDIIVGAPLYGDNKGIDTYDTGRVYIYYQTAKNSFRSNRKDILDGIDSLGRFGHSVTKLGDINYDGYNDLAVGAPYAGEDKKGAVYIYHGSKKGIITEVSQIIKAADLDPGMSTFGFSLSGGWDQDGNSYPDILVGAYESDRAVFLRTRPVVRVYASLKIDPVVVNLKHRSCSLINDDKVTCLTIYTCLEYTGVGVADELYFDLEWKLDTLQHNRTREEQRAYYLTTEKDIVEKNTVKLTKKATWCTSSFAYVLDDISDKLTPIAVDFKFALQKTPSGGRRRRRSLEPVLDQYIRTSVRTEAQILKNCGRDNICYPDLVVNSIRVSTAHIVGSKAELEVLVMVENRAEDAFNTQLFINLPKGVSLKGIQGIQSVQGVAPVSCDRVRIDDEDMVICDLGNPLPSRAKTNFTLKVDPEDVDGSKPDLIFALQVNSTNPENITDVANNYASVSIPVTASAELHMNAKSDPEQININTTRARLYSDKPPTRDVEHLYQLQNNGPSTTEIIDLQIYWPSHDIDGEPILPLSGPPQVTKGTAECTIKFVTPANSSETLLYSLSEPDDLDFVLQEQSNSRGRAKRATKEKVECSEWCTVIHCMVGRLEKDQNFLITIRATFLVEEFLRNQLPNALLKSTAFARVKKMPYELPSVDENLFATDKKSITTTVNVDRPDPGKRPIEIWIIAVAVSAGLLVLLLIIILLWWCGFFKRRKPEDEGYMVANGNPRNIEDKMFE